MLPQHTMIEQVKKLCQQDPAVSAAMMYGSYALGGGDAHSDIEFVIFFDDEALVHLDKTGWLAQIAPVSLVFDNEFGITTVIFENLVRGEFHFDRVSELDEIARAWEGTVGFPTLESTLVVDKTGQLTPHIEKLIGPPLQHGQHPDEIQEIANGFINWFLFGRHVLERGEYARALEILAFVQRYLLWLVRIVEHSTVHWYIASRDLEHDLTPAAYARYITCTSSLMPDELTSAYRHIWEWGIEILPQLSGATLPSSLIQNITDTVSRQPSNVKT